MDDDVGIAMLFGEWTAADVFINEPHDDDDDETDRRCDRADAVARRLAAIPAFGLTGFVLKTVALLRYDPPLPGSIDDTATATLARALLEDALRLVPELRECPVLARLKADGSERIIQLP